MFQEFYINNKDILNQGSVWCAYFVSNLLKQFNLTPVGRANVDRVIVDLEKKWWSHLPVTTDAKQIPAGSILVREASHGETYNKMHKHIGFYIGDEQAISNNSIHFTGLVNAGFVPVQHHRTYNNTRNITAILSWDRDNLFADWLYHYELPMECINATNEETLQKQGLSQQEIEFRLGKNEWLKNGRLCGPTCIVMALQYFGIDTTLQQYIPFAEEKITYINAKTGEEKTVSCFTKETWRYHSWLIHITKTLAKDNEITSSLWDFSRDTFLPLAQEILTKNNNWEKTVLIVSVTPEFEVIEWKKWGHLVVIAWIDYNWDEMTLIICDPLSATKKQLPLQNFLDSASGKYFTISLSQ